MRFKIIKERRPFGGSDMHIPLEMLEKWIEEEYGVSFSGSYKIKNLYPDWDYGDEDEKDYYSQGYRKCLSNLLHDIENALRVER